MTRDQLRDVALHLLGEIAPEARRHDLSPDEPLCDALGLDSLDVLNFVIAVHETFGIDVPESDYPRLGTLRGCVDYLTRPRPGR
jgi:acyl carrier protein